MPPLVVSQPRIHNRMKLPRVMSLLRLAVLCTSRCDGSSLLRQAFVSSARRSTRQPRAGANQVASPFHSSAISWASFATPRHRRLAAASSSSSKNTASKSAKVNSRQQSSPCLAVVNNDSDDDDDKSESTSSTNTLATASKSSKKAASKLARVKSRQQSSPCVAVDNNNSDEDEELESKSSATRLAAASKSSKKAASKSAKVSSRQKISPCLPVGENNEEEASESIPSTTGTTKTDTIISEAATTATASSPIVSEPTLELLHPSQMLNGTIPYPKSLSPSAILEFKNCPQSFLFQYLWDLKQPTSLVLAKGSMCHEALDKIFDLEPQARTLKHLHNLFRSSWAEHRKDEKYRILFERLKPIDANNNDNNTNGDGAVKEEDLTEWDVAAEQEWGRSGLQLLQNYYDLEDPRHVLRPNPIKREIWVRADLTVDPTLGVTGSNHHPQVNGDGAVNGTETFHVRGIVDRLDMVKVSKSQVALRIVDYKTGKAPNLKYSKAMNEHIRNEVFYQLKIYALLLREKNSHLHSSSNNVIQIINGTAEADESVVIDPISSSVTSSASGGALDLRMLRLFYLTSESGRAQHVDLDLGPTQEARDQVLQETHADLSKIWTDIRELVSSQDPKAFVGCKRSFCYCHKCRPRFVPGSLWEPDSVL